MIVTAWRTKSEDKGCIRPAISPALRQDGYIPSKHFSRREMGYTVGGSSTFRRCRIRSHIMNAVVAVNYFDESKGFWRFGYLVKADRKWAWCALW
jgi:hypothetical protein